MNKMYNTLFMFLCKGVAKTQGPNLKSHNIGCAITCLGQTINPVGINTKW